MCGGIGNNQHQKDYEQLGNNFPIAKSQEDIANDLNITARQLQNYKNLLSLIPELQDMVEDENLKATTATYLAKQQLSYIKWLSCCNNSI